MDRDDDDVATGRQSRTSATQKPATKQRTRSSERRNELLLRPSFEIIKPVCTCDRELSVLFYELTGKKKFDEFADRFGLSKKARELMGFANPPEEGAVIAIPRMKICCLRTLRTGSVVSITVPKFQTSDDDHGTNRKYPESLPGPFSYQKKLYWAS